MSSIRRHLTLALFFIAFVLGGSAMTLLAAQNTVSVQVQGTFDQSGARSMLRMVNDFRTNEGTQEGDQAWWLNPDGSGERIAINGLTEMAYDYKLERIAMQRAAELAVSFDHLRPDGATYVFALSDGVNGENIACGQKTAQEAFTDWLEADEETFDAQGHRVNMLGGYYVDEETGDVYQKFMTTIGIAHFIYDGVDYWVQEFGTAVMEPTASEPCDEARTMMVAVAAADISDYEMTVNKEIEVEYHSEVDLSDDYMVTQAVITTTQYDRTVEHRYPVETTYTWELLPAYADLVTVTGNVLYGESRGEGSIAVTNAQGKTANVSFEVVPKDIANADVSAEKTEFLVGETIRFISGTNPKVVLDGEELIYYQKEDYYINVYYENGRRWVYHAGDQSATPSESTKYYVSFAGHGNYTGETTRRLEINVNPIENLQISAAGETELTMEYGTSVQSSVECQNYLGTFRLIVNVEDESIVSVSSVSSTNKEDRTFPVGFTGLKAGSTQVEIQVPEKENAYSASNVVEFTVNVEPADLGRAVRLGKAILSGIESSYAYTGSPITPKPVITYANKTLNEGEDYTVSYEIEGEETQPVGSFRDATTVRVLITGRGENFTGTAETSFIITPVKLEASLEKTSYPYRQVGVFPVPTVSWNETVLEKDVDYVLVYGANNEVGKGKGTVTITGIGDYILAGTQTLSFDIEKADIADAVVSAEKTEFLVGETIRFISGTKPKVVLDGEELIYQRREDYWINVYYEDERVMVYNAGDQSAIPRESTKYYVSFVGHGNYTGETTQRLEINVSPIENLQIRAAGETEFKMEHGASADVSMECQYLLYGDEQLNINVQDESIVSASQNNFKQDSSNGKTIIPVTFTALKAGTTQVEIQVPEKENAHSASNVITYTVTVSKIPFEEHVTAAFKDPNEVTDCEFIPPKYEWEPEVRVYYDEASLLSKGTDYTVAYEDNIYAGTAKVIISPVDTERYEGDVTLEFTIRQRQATMALDQETPEVGYGTSKVITFTGAYSSKTPQLSVEGDCLDAELTSFNALNGRGTVTVTGRKTGTAKVSIAQEGDEKYTGTSAQIDVTVTETQIAANDVTISLSEESFIYDGMEKKPEVTVQIDGNTLDGEFYDYAYSSCTNPGSAYVTVTGKNGPSFTKKAYYAIHLCDTGELSGLIGQAKAEFEAISSGALRISADGSDVTSDQKWVTQADLNALNSALTAAENLLSDWRYTQAKVEEKSSAMEAALADFEAVKKNGLIIKVTGIMLQPENAVLAPGESMNLAASVVPSNATRQDIAFSSSDPEIASVDEAGLVSAVNFGNAVITAQAVDGGQTASCSVRVAKNLSGYQASLAFTSTDYTGTEIRPEVTVKEDDSTEPLVKGTDFTVDYQDNVEAGTATVVVTGTGTYAGSIRLTFTITKKEDPGTNSGSGNGNGSGSGSDSGSASGNNAGAGSGTGTGEGTDGGTGSGTGTDGDSGIAVNSQSTEPDHRSAQEVENIILGMAGDKDLPYSTFGKLQVRQKTVKKNAITIAWKRVPGAVKYVIYGNQCGKRAQKITEVGGTSYTQKKLKKGTYYKYTVAAVTAGNETVAVSKMVHIATKGGKVANPKKITVTGTKKNRLTLKKGKTQKLKAKQTADVSGGKIRKHRALLFETSDPAVATVTAKGKVKAVGKGNCIIYVYGQNGAFAAVKVKVG